MKLLVLFELIALAAAEKVRYDGYQTLFIEPKDDDQLNFLRLLEKDLEGTIPFWTSPTHTLRPTTILLSPRYQDYMKQLLDAKQIKHSVVIDDVQILIDSQARSQEDVKIDRFDDFDYSIYHTYDEIQDWVYDIAAAHSDIAYPFQIATSTEGRDINAIKISTGGNETRPAVYWQGGIHAREWISPATLMYITKSLLDDFGVDPEVTEVLDTFDFYIVPALNVDGYAYTWTNDHLWRKTRSVNSGSACRGVDPNRNYKYQYGGKGSSDDPCSNEYRGPNPFSEPELAATTSFLLNADQDFISFIDFHSFSQYWLAPWSYSKEALPTDDHFHQNAAAAEAVSALKSVYGTDYIYGPSAMTLYPASGCSIDWAYKVLGAKYSYLVELRDDGRFAFLLPEFLIKPTGEETYAAVKAMLQYIIEHP